MKPIHEQPMIGIDPDSDKCGVAIYRPEPNTMQLINMTPVELMEWLNKFHSEEGIRKVYIEASHKTTSNWHTCSHDKPSVAAKKGYDVGLCHEVGILLVDHCRHYNIPFEEVLPLAKIWGGKDRKCRHEDLLRALSPRHIALCCPNMTRSNQELRDAALLILGHVREYDLDKPESHG